MPDLAAALQAVLPAGVGVGWADPKATATGLLPGESLPGAVPARLAEFAAGRRAARAALRDLGWSAMAVPMGPDRAPVWPAGLVGSISHCNNRCVAIVSAAHLGLGIDLEPDNPLEPDLWPEVLGAGDSADSGLMAKAVFCAKEAAYKAQYPQSRALFGFDVLRVVMDADLFTATFRRDIPPFPSGFVIAGRIVRAQGHVAALCWLPSQVLKIP